MWNQWKRFVEGIKHKTLTYFGAQNGPEVGPLRPIWYTCLKVAPMSILSKIDVNPEEIFLTKNSEIWILDYLEAQMAKTFVLLEPIFQHQWTRKWSFKWTQRKIFKKIDENLYWDLFGTYLGSKADRKFGSQEPFFTHWNFPQYAVNQIPWSLIKNFWENGRKVPQFF